MYGVEHRLPAAAEDGIGLRLIDEQIGPLDQEMASLLSEYQDAVQRLAEVPGLGVDSAQQIIAEVGPTAATFPSEKCLSSWVGWVGACPGDDESAGVNYSHRSPKGNRHMRSLLNQAANAAARTKGSIFGIVYRRSVPRLGHNQAIGAIAHRQCRLVWLILHQGVRYEERGQTIQATAHLEDDPATPKPRLSDRTTESSTKPSTSAVIFDPGVLPALFFVNGAQESPFLMTHTMSAAPEPSRFTPRGSVRRASGFVLTGNPEPMPPDWSR